MNYKLFLIALLGLGAAASLNAQTSINPDLSVVGDFRVFGHNNDAFPDQTEKFNFATPSMELMVSGYLNPYARADAVIAWHGEENAEIEEVYATILRGLPLGMNFRIGKYLIEFGRLNPVHEHAWSFVKRPLPHQTMFGHHGLADMAIRSSFLLPTGNAFTELMVGVIKGDALAGHHHDEAGHEHATEESQRHPGLFGRLTTSFATSDEAELALGWSLLNAVHALTEIEIDSLAPIPEPDQLRAWLTGLDLKYKHKPSRYTTLLIEAEGIARSAEQHDGDKLSSYGGYGYLDYRFSRQYNLGGIFEYTSVKVAGHNHDTGEHHIHTADTWRAGLFLGYAPIEETSLVRLTGHWTEPEGADGFWDIGVQFLFSLGPHQPHNF